MVQNTSALSIELRNDVVLVDNTLKINFHRTIRVPDNHQTSFLPPDLGTFPLKPVSTYTGKISSAMTAKGGLFLPMYRK